MGLRAVLLLLLAFPALVSSFSIGSGPAALGLRGSALRQPHALKKSTRTLSHASFSLRMQEDKDKDSAKDGDSSFMTSNASSDFPDMVPVQSTNPAFFVVGGILGCVPLVILLIETCKVRSVDLPLI